MIRLWSGLSRAFASQMFSENWNLIGTALVQLVCGVAAMGCSCRTADNRDRFVSWLNASHSSRVVAGREAARPAHPQRLDASAFAAEQQRPTLARERGAPTPIHRRHPPWRQPRAVPQHFVPTRLELEWCSGGQGQCRRRGLCLGVLRSRHAGEQTGNAGAAQGDFRGGSRNVHARERGCLRREESWVANREWSQRRRACSAAGAGTVAAAIAAAAPPGPM